MPNIKLFENQHVRSEWDAQRELWYFSIVDIVAVLTDSADAAAYWRKLKQRLKMKAVDGKSRLTDVADTKHRCRFYAGGSGRLVAVALNHRFFGPVGKKIDNPQFNGVK